MALTSEQINEITAIINNELEQLKSNIVHLEEATKPIALDNSIGRLTRMDAIGGKGVNDSLLENNRMRLLALEKTLLRIETPFYGTCKNCRGQIAYNRLKAIPEATHCSNCNI
jgi:DnaK suppressor protein